MRLFVLLLVAGSACREHRQTRGNVAPPPTPTPPAAVGHEGALDHKGALAAALAHPASFTGAPCDVDAPQPPPELDKLSISSGPAPDDTYAYLLDYWRVTGSILEIVNAAHGPIRSIEPEGPLVTLVIDTFVEPGATDPQPDGTFPSGELRGRVLLWRGDAIACGADVTVHNSPTLRVPKPAPIQGDISSTEDPLAKPRVDLVNEALRAGLAALRKPAG